MTCLEQRSEFAEFLDAVERAGAELVRSTNEKIRGEFTIESADRQRAEVTVVAMSDGAVSSFIVIHSAGSRTSAVDSRRAPLQITSFHFELAAIGRSRTARDVASAATTGSEAENRSLPAGWGRGVFFCSAAAAADRRADLAIHPRIKNFTLRGDWISPFICLLKEHYVQEDPCGYRAAVTLWPSTPKGCYFILLYTSLMQSPILTFFSEPSENLSATLLA